MLKLPNSIEPAIMAENIVHLRDAASSLDGRVSDLEVTAPKDYSTTETATGQKWIDGREIYCKAYSGNFGPIETTISYNFMENIEADFVILMNAYAKSGTSIYGINITLISGNIVGNVSPSFSNRDFITYIYYLKAPTPGRAPEDSEPEPEVKKTTKKKTTK